MESKRQLIDSLTSHISLYSSQSSSSSSSNHNPNPRSSILRWFSSLSPHQRQSHLTIVDQSFTQLLIQLQSKIQSNGHGFFIILPDIPSSTHPNLPSFCFRKSHGLLSRNSQFSQPERSIRDSILLFDSKEGEGVSSRSSCLDSVTVSKEFVENVDRFVEVMDGVSDGGFLTGEESVMLGSLEWVELDWLKVKGYYSLEAFVANRLEVALRLSWLNCNLGKRKGVKLKEKVAGAAAGVAANVYWRKKGCVDWWVKLDDQTKRKVFQTALGKAAKSLISDVLHQRSSALEDELLIVSGGKEQPLRYEHTRWHGRADEAFRGKYIESWSILTIPPPEKELSSIAQKFNCLFVLCEISNMLLAFQHGQYEEERLFFSSLGSVGTITDRLLRKLRGLLMVVSLDFTKVELLEDLSSTKAMKKHKEKLVSSNHKKKGKARDTTKSIPVTISLKSKSILDKPAKDDGDKLDIAGNINAVQSCSLAGTTQEKDLKRETPTTAVEMERGDGVVNRSESTSKKSKRARKKHKNDGFGNPVECRVSRTAITKSPSSAMAQGQITHGENGLVYRNPDTGNMPKGTLIIDEKPVNNSTCICTTCDGKSIGASGDDGLKYSRPLERMIASQGDRVGTVDYIDGPAVVAVVENDGVSVNQDVSCRAPEHAKELETQSLISKDVTIDMNKKESKSPVEEEDTTVVNDTERLSSSGYPSYEWPSVAPIQLSSVNSHLPAATDRLHLDVGHNWQNHFHQPGFMQTVHQVRNPPIENGRNEIHSRPMPMSLDWPPMVRSVSGLFPSMTCSYNTGYMSRRQSFKQSFSAQAMQLNAITIDDERMYSGDFIDSSQRTNSQELVDEHDSHWMAEEDFTVSGMDYSQCFGGGVMYWDSSDHPVASFSRPPSLSSDDSSWAWREADMNRTVDDMVAFSSSYSTNGLTSPSGASFCSPFDPLGQGHQAVGYVIPSSEVTGKVLHSSSTMTDLSEENVSGSLATFPGDIEAKTGDLFPYPILRPIIIPSMSRDRSRSEFKRSQDHKSPCVPPSRREEAPIKRPPSPVVLCVPRAPRPPPPSPVGDSRKHRGFPTVRSGSSSPRHWGVKGWFHDGISFEESCVRIDGSEVVWPSWRKKGLSARQLTQTLPGALLQDRLIAISQLARDQEHPDLAIPLQSPELLNCSVRKASLPLMHSLLHDEIESFCKKVAGVNMIRKPFINWAVKRVTRSLQVLWPRSRTNIFGSNATGLSLPTSDVDLVVCLPPVRNLEPIKEAGILEGRNGIKETSLQHAARYLANQEWVKNDSLKIVENTAIPIIMLVVEVPCDLIVSAASNVEMPRDPAEISCDQRSPSQNDTGGLENSASPNFSQPNTNCGKDKDVQSIRLDISFKAPSHTGLQTTELVKELTEQFPAATPLALVLKQFLADRSLDQSYSGGLSSYCLILLITRFLQHEHHHGRPINQNFGGLLMDFFYFFGNVFDPRRMCISVQGSGVYINREKGYSIDPIYIDDPLFPANNVGRNCFRIHQCIKAFADAYTILEDKLTCLPDGSDPSSLSSSCKLLPQIIPSIGLP